MNSKRTVESKERALGLFLKPDAEEPGPLKLLGDMRSLIDETRARVARTVNTEQTMLYWKLGSRIRTELFSEGRAGYGERVVETLSKELVREYGRGFGKRNLFNMVRFSEVFPDLKKVQTVFAQLSWSHFLEIIRVEEPLEREFYIEMAKLERWSVRVLKERMRSMLFQRTTLSKKPKETIRQELNQLRNEGLVSVDLVLRDPYFLDFLNLGEGYSEQELEDAILREMEGFLLEFGTGLSFLGRKKWMPIGGENFYLDLLFYHREMKRLVAIDLKLGRFTASFKGQMELYLRWLDRYERKPGEGSPLGLILCSETNAEQIELLELDRGAIRVAEYLTQLPPRELLKNRLVQALQQARSGLLEMPGFVVGNRL